MKKILLPFVFIIGLLITASLQQAHAQANFGLRAGLNYTNLNDKANNFDPDSRTGFMVGGYLNISLPMSPISIQPEATYSQKGYETGGATVKLNYLEVPVLAKINIAPGPISPHVYLGPYAGFVVNSEVSGSGVTFNINDAQTDYGGIIGAGADINAGVTKLNLSVRYGFGLTDAIESIQGKNSTLSLVAGLSF